MLTVLVIIALVVAVIGLTAGLLALITLGRLRRGVGLLGRGGAGGRESFLEASARHVDAAERTRVDVDALRTELAHERTQVATLGHEFATLQADTNGALRGDIGALPDNIAALRDTIGALRGEFDALSRGARSEVDAIRRELTATSGVRGSDLDQVRQAERVERARQLQQLQERVESDVAAMRADLERAQQALVSETQTERARWAADNSAARDQLRGVIDKVDQVISTALRRVGLVRYDAFDDLGGRLSFSLAVLDSRGDGVALTSLAGRAETRVYAKSITAGVGVTELSPEERAAVAAALAG